MESQVLVLGGGPAGYAAGFLAADLGMDVTIVDADRQLGGTCLLRGCIPSKALLHVAEIVSRAREAAEWGVSFSDARIDLEKLRARKDRVVEQLANGLRELAKRRKVRVIQARGILVDSQTLQLEGGDRATYESERISFQHCILATGSRPSLPKALDLPTGRVMDSTAALALPDVPESLLVVGGGYIGLELGTVYAELGSRVTVVEMTDGLLPGADRDLVKPLQQRLARKFAGVHLQTKVTGLKDLGQKIEVTFDGTGELAGSARQFERVLVAIGRRPNSSGIGLENTRVQVDERGFVRVDRQQRTADPRILAIGDLVGEPMLAHKALHEGKVAAEVLHGRPVQFEPLAIPAVIFTDPEIAWAGLTQEQARLAGREVAVAQFPWQASGRAIANGRTDGLTKWILDPQTDRVLGAGIVGPGAGELIAEAVLAIEMGCTAGDLAHTIHPHPTLSETLQVASEVHLGIATEVYRPKRP